MSCNFFFHYPESLFSLIHFLKVVMSICLTELWRFPDVIVIFT